MLKENGLKNCYVLGDIGGDKKMTTIDTNERSDPEDRIKNSGENYHYNLYLITLNPSFRSYIKRSYQDSTFMTQIMGEFMDKVKNEFKFVDAGIEYNSKDTCHVHIVLASRNDLKSFRYNGISINDLLKFKRGIYVDVRAFPEHDLDHVIKYINKYSKPHEVMNYYRNEYGFI